MHMHTAICCHLSFYPVAFRRVLPSVSHSGEIFPSFIITVTHFKLFSTTKKSRFRVKVLTTLHDLAKHALEGYKAFLIIRPS